MTGTKLNSKPRNTLAFLIKGNMAAVITKSMEQSFFRHLRVLS